MNKRLIVKQILQKFSNRNNILSSTKIIDYADRFYGVKISRNTITAYIKDFIENSDLYNLNVQIVEKQGYYVEQNPEQEALLQMLDALFHEKLNDSYVKDGLLEKLYEQLGCSKNIINNTFKNDSSLESNKYLSKKDILIEINKAKNEKKFVELTLEENLVETVFPCGYFRGSKDKDYYFKCIYFDGNKFQEKDYHLNQIRKANKSDKDFTDKRGFVLLNEYRKYYNNNFVPKIKYKVEKNYQNYMGFLTKSPLYHIDDFNDNPLNNLLSIECITIDNNNLLYYSKNSADKDAEKFFEIMELEYKEDALICFTKILVKSITNIDFIKLFNPIRNCNEYSVNLFDLLIVSIFKILINSDTWIHDKSNYEIIIRKCLDTLNEINICNKLIIFDWSKFYYLKDDILISNNIYDSLIKLIMSDNNISFNDVIDNENEFLNLINKAKVLNDQSMINFIESILIKFLSH